MLIDERLKTVLIEGKNYTKEQADQEVDLLNKQLKELQDEGEFDRANVLATNYLDSVRKEL